MLIWNMCGTRIHDFTSSTGGWIEEKGEFVVLSRVEMVEVIRTSMKTDLLTFTTFDLLIRRDNSHLSHN